MARSGTRNRYRWAILAVGALTQGSVAAVFFGIPILAPALRDDYGLTLSQLGVVIGAVSFGVVATVFPWGVAADRVGERVVMATGLGLAGLALVQAAVADDYRGLVVALAAAGAFGASVQAAGGRAVMGWFDPSQLGLALGIRQTAVVFGGAAAALALPPLAERGGSRAGLAGLAVLALVAAVASALALRAPPERPRRVRGSTRATLRDTRLWRLCAGSALLLAAQTTVLSFTVLFLYDVRGLSPREAAGALAVMQVLGGALRIASGVWSDRIGVRLTPLLRIAFAFAAMLAVSAALTNAPLPLLLPIFVAAGALSSAWNALSFVATAELAGRSTAGAALGVQQASLASAAALTPILFVAVVDATSWGVGFAVGAAVALAGTLSLVSLAARETDAAARAYAAGPSSSTSP